MKEQVLGGNMHGFNLIMAGSDDSWMSVKEAAQYLGKSTHWLYQNRERLKLPAVAIGGTYRFEKAALARWISDNQQVKKATKVTERPSLKVTL